MNTDHEDRLHHIILLVDRIQGSPCTYMSRPQYGLHNPLKLPCQPYGIRSLNFNFNFIWFDILHHVRLIALCSMRCSLCDAAPASPCCNASLPV